MPDETKDEERDAQEEQPLPDADLEKVSGGMWGVPVIRTTTTTTTNPPPRDPASGLPTGKRM